MTRIANFKFKNGDSVLDPTTGYQGKITSRIDYLTGNNRYGVESLDANSKVVNEYFDEERLTAVDA